MEGIKSGYRICSVIHQLVYTVDLSIWKT